MKVTITKEAKQYIYASEMPTCNTIIKSFKDDEWSSAQYADMAAREWLRESDYDDYVVNVLTATSTMSKNCRVWDALGDGTHTLDIWTEATVETTNGFLKIGFYITDVWQITGLDDDDTAQYMYARYFTEAE